MLLNVAVLFLHSQAIAASLAFTKHGISHHAEAKLLESAMPEVYED